MTDKDERPAPTNVISALCRVMDELPTIAKEVHQPAAGQEQGVKYPFRSIEQITPYTQELFARFGVVLAPYRIGRWDMREIQVRDKPWTDDRLTVLYRCYGPGGPTDFIELEVPGIGRDNSDKGSNKAMTAAMKYALTQLLQIAGDDPDFDRPETDQRPISERDDLTPAVLTATYVDAYLDRAHARGLNDDQIGAIVGGVTARRTEDVRRVFQTEWDALNAATKAAVEARAATRPASPPVAAGEPPEPAPATDTPPAAPDAPTADPEFEALSKAHHPTIDLRDDSWFWSCRCGLDAGLQFETSEAADEDHGKHVASMWKAAIDEKVAAAKNRRR